MSKVQGCGKGKNGSISPESQSLIFKYSSVLSALQDILQGISKDVLISIFKEHLTG